MTRERPILFNAPMVRAILDGTKTQTRRVVKPRKDLNFGVPLASHELAGEVNDGDFTNSPYGQPGDRLWVRETFQGPMWEEGTWDPDTDYHKPEFCEYRADGGPMPEYVDFEDNLHQGWKPSIHMPRWASRITLEITGVRVERLRAISHDDALAEGVADFAATLNDEPHPSGDSPEQASRRLQWPQRQFRQLWDSINVPGSWDANPWVWVVEFNRVDAKDRS